MRALIPGHSLPVGLRAPCLLSISEGKGGTESTPALGQFHIHLEGYLEVYLSTDFRDLYIPRIGRVMVRATMAKMLRISVALWGMVDTAL